MARANDMADFSIDSISAGPFLTNTYLVSSKGESLLIDSGTDATEILARLPLKGKKVVGIISTHGHFDHTADMEDLKAELECGFCIGEGEDTTMEWSYTASPAYMGKELQRIRVDRKLREGDTIEFGDSSMLVVQLPGHTPGSIGLIAGGCFFTGDTLFKGSIGRTDLGGSMEDMVRTLKRIAEMDPALRLFPGHGPESTLGEELDTNPFLRGFRGAD